jgi:deoxyadenosine/deoxycytidine kinase
MMAYISRLSRLKSVIKRVRKEVTVIVTERSVFTDYEIFAKMLHDDKKIEDINYNI